MHLHDDTTFRNAAHATVTPTNTTVKAFGLAWYCSTRLYDRARSWTGKDEVDGTGCGLGTHIVRGNGRQKLGNRPSETRSETLTTHSIIFRETYLRVIYIYRKLWFAEIMQLLTGLWGLGKATRNRTRCPSCPDVLYTCVAQGHTNRSNGQRLKIA